MLDDPLIIFMIKLILGAIILSGVVGAVLTIFAMFKIRRTHRQIANSRKELFRRG